jgi:transposase InsO family protein
MEVLENTENDLQIDHRTIDCYVITLTSEIQELRAQYVTNPLNMGMLMNLPWYLTQTQAKKDISYYLMDYYNRQRPHQANDGLSPVTAENRLKLVYGIC